MTGSDWDNAALLARVEVLSLQLGAAKADIRGLQRVEDEFARVEVERNRTIRELRDRLGEAGSDVDELTEKLEAAAADLREAKGDRDSFEEDRDEWQTRAEKAEREVGRTVGPWTCVDRSFRLFVVEELMSSSDPMPHLEDARLQAGKALLAMGGDNA